jgi:ABC-type Zn uptake system ZnuABC Zn-binding protein ZnuA
VARLLPILLAAAALATAGCGREDTEGSGGLSVVATTTQAADMVRNVGGEAVSVRALLEPSADPHEFEPRPSDARAVAEADLVVRSGGDLDEWLGDLIDNAGGDAQRLTLIDSVERIGDDPHWWQDPRNAERAVPAIRDALAAADPGAAASFHRNAAAYTKKLRSLDRGIARCMASVPAGERKLVTTHDALDYFARRYDIEVVGALIPSLSSQAQPSAGETDRLVKQIEREGVKTIFPESALSPKLEEAVARETGAAVGGALWADALGPEGSSGATYVDAMAANTAELVKGLTGGRQSCRPAV